MVRSLQLIYNIIVFTSARMRGKFWGLFLKKIGVGCEFMSGVKISSPFSVEIGNCVGINHHVELGGQMGLKIGNHVMIGPYSQILTANHGYTDYSKPMKTQDVVGGLIVIEDDVWIGSFVVILPHVKVGRGAIIGAHSVVTHDVEPYSIIGGAPAHFIKVSIFRR